MFEKVWFDCGECKYFWFIFLSTLCEMGFVFFETKMLLDCYSQTAPAQYAEAMLPATSALPSELLPNFSCLSCNFKVFIATEFLLKQTSCSLSNSEKFRVFILYFKLLNSTTIIIMLLFKFLWIFKLSCTFSLYFVRAFNCCTFCYKLICKPILCFIVLLIYLSSYLVSLIVRSGYSSFNNL